jgi:hypothetical protein
VQLELYRRDWLTPVLPFNVRHRLRHAVQGFSFSSSIRGLAFAFHSVESPCPSRPNNNKLRTTM